MRAVLEDRAVPAGPGVAGAGTVRIDGHELLTHPWIRSSLGTLGMTNALGDLEHSEVSRSNGHGA